jgi:lysyl-tRNA synthetase class 2
MNLVRELYQTIVKEIYGTTKFTAKGHAFDLAGEWPMVNYIDIVRERTGIDLLTSSDLAISEKLRELSIIYEGENRERMTDTLWKYVRKTISGPVFLVHHPKLVSPLAKESRAFP